MPDNSQRLLVSHTYQHLAVGYLDESVGIHLAGPEYITGLNSPVQAGGLDGLFAGRWLL